MFSDIKKEEETEQLWITHNSITLSKQLAAIRNAEHRRAIT